jgi:hypothetical protein
MSGLRVVLHFRLIPSPGMGHIADDRLSARVDVDMFDHHLLPSTSPHVRQRIHLGATGMNTTPLHRRKAESPFQQKAPPTTGLSRIRGGPEPSGRLTPPARQRNKNAAGRDQTRQSRPNDWSGNRNSLAKSDLRYVSQPNGTCERHTRNKLAGCRRQSEKVLSASTERKQEAEQRARLVERVDGRRTVRGRIEVEDGLSEIKTRDGGSQVVQDVVWHRLDPSLSLRRGGQDLSARKLNQRINGIDVAENRSAGLIRGLLIEDDVVACAGWRRTEYDDRVSRRDDRRESDTNKNLAKYFHW